MRNELVLRVQLWYNRFEICGARFPKTGVIATIWRSAAILARRKSSGRQKIQRYKKSVYRVRCAFFCMAEKNCRSSLCGRKLKSRGGRCGRALSYRGACAQRICGKARSDRKGRFFAGVRRLLKKGGGMRIKIDGVIQSKVESIYETVAAETDKYYKLVKTEDLC